MIDAAVRVPLWRPPYRRGGRDKMKEEGCCRMCKRPSDVRPLTRHHIVPKRWPGWRQFGVKGYLYRDSDANVVPLCRDCHDLVEDWTDSTGRKLLRKLLAPQEATLAIMLRGREWFDLQYPPRKRRLR